VKARYLSFLLLVSSASAGEYPARVIGITDGDTLTVRTAQKTHVKIRLAGIDAPESSRDFGTKAKQAASDLAFGKTVKIIERDKDRYGRTVADIALPVGRSLNREMVRNGMAWWYRKHAANDQVLALLEAEARQAKRGSWSQADPKPPWEWRKPDMSVSAEVIGNRRSHVYHRSNCPAAVRMKDANRVRFAKAAESGAAGYQAGWGLRFVRPLVTAYSHSHACFL
jgi:micrococcal nuclease